MNLVGLASPFGLDFKAAPFPKILSEWVCWLWSSGWLKQSPRRLLSVTDVSTTWVEVSFRWRSETHPTKPHHLILKMTFAQVIETTVNDNSLPGDCSQPDDHNVSTHCSNSLVQNRLPFAREFGKQLCSCGKLLNAHTTLKVNLHEYTSAKFTNLTVITSSLIRSLVLKKSSRSAPRLYPHDVLSIVRAFSHLYGFNSPVRKLINEKGDHTYVSTQAYKKTRMRQWTTV